MKLITLFLSLLLAAGAAPKVSLKRAATLEGLNKLPANAGRELSARRLKIVGVLTLPISRLLRGKIADHISELGEIEGRSAETHLGDFTAFEKSSFFAASYAKWLKAEGVQIVPVDIYSPPEELERLVRSVDGLLFTGGAVPLFQRENRIDLDAGVQRQLSFYARRLTEIVRLAKSLNSPGRTYPIWTTCLGFEGLILGESDLQLSLADVDNANNSAVLRLKLGGRNGSRRRGKSRFLDFFSDSELKLMQSEKLFFFNHEHAFAARDFAADTALTQQYRVIATAHAKDPAFTEPIVAAIEHVSLPFYGVQFHPEKNQYEPRVSADTSPEALALLRRFAAFFCGQLRGEHSERDLETVHAYLDKFEYITAHNVGVFEKLYIFKPKAVAV